MATKPIPMRLPEDDLERARALLPHARLDPDLAEAPPESVADLLRYCISLSLKELERKYAAQALRMVVQELRERAKVPCSWPTRIGKTGLDLKNIELGALEEELRNAGELAESQDLLAWLAKAWDREQLKRAVTLVCGGTSVPDVPPWKLIASLKPQQRKKIASLIVHDWEEALTWARDLHQSIDDLHQAASRALESCEAGEWRSAGEALGSTCDLRSRFPGSDSWWKPIYDAIEIAQRVAISQAASPGPRLVNKRGGRPRKRVSAQHAVAEHQEAERLNPSRW